MRTNNSKQAFYGVFAALIVLVIPLLPAAGLAQDIGLEQALDAPVPPVTTDDYFGTDVAICGDTAYVGAPYVPSQPDPENWRLAAGVVFVYGRDTSGDWLLENTILPFDLFSAYGRVIACAEDAVAVSSGGEYPDLGRVSIYERNASGEYSLVYSVLGPVTDFNTYFGQALAMDGDTLVVGARFDDNGAQVKTGAAYVYQRQLDGTWTEVTKFPHDPTVLDYDDEFGVAVGISNDTVAIGAVSDDDMQPGAGAVYLFDRDAGGEDNWGFVMKIPGPAIWGGYFGKSLDLDEETLAVTVNEDYDGYVHLYGRNYGGEENWGYIAECGPVESYSTSYYWNVVTVKGDWFALGMPRDDPLGLGDEGLVSVFQWSVELNSCAEAAKITSPRAASASQFGRSVDISGDRLIVGEPGFDVLEGNEGAAYIYYRPGDGSADLSVSIADDPDPVETGSTVDYTITVTNLGPDDAEDVVVSFALAKGVTVTKVSSSDTTDCSRRDRECTFELLASGEQVTAVVTAKPRKKGTISLCAEVETEDPDDPDASNNEACELTTVQ